MNTTRRALIGALATAALLPRAATLMAAPKPLVEVWKSPTCGCCKDWIRHLQAEGFSVQAHDTPNTAIRARLGVALGARPSSFTGLSGLGDLVLTCTGDLSRNRQVGLGIAAGKSLDTIVTELGHVAEGVRCVQAVSQLAHERGIAMPIVDAVARVLFENEKPQDAIQQLLAREAREESI